MTGSAAVGHDMNRAANSSVSKTTWATILAGGRDPADRLPVAPAGAAAFGDDRALGPGLAQGNCLADLDAGPGPPKFQVINITDIFVIVVLFGAGHRLLPVPDRPLSRGAGPGPDRSEEALREAIEQVGGALVASAGTVIVGLGMLWFSSFAKIQYTGPAIALSLAIGLLASLTLAPVLIPLAPRGGLLPVHGRRTTRRGPTPMQESLASDPAVEHLGQDRHAS